MNEVRTFRARTLHDALNVVRRELGAEAVILQTRRTPASRLWPWSRRDVEVTAQTEVRPTAKVDSPAVMNRLRPNAAIIPATITPTTITPAVIAPATISRAEIAPLDSKPTADSQPEFDVTHQAASLQQLIDQLTQQLEPERQELPSVLRSLHQQLRRADVSEESARRWISRLRREEPHTAWDDFGEAQLKLTALVERELLCTGGIRISPTRRKVVALVGPTGVGKTTTIAKLAANFKLRAGLRIGLITLDSYRIAAADQLRTYAEIIGISMRAAANVRELRAAMDEFSDLDLVLVDTAGHNPNDDLQRQELKNLLAEAQADEVHLVLSLAASSQTIARTIEKFSDVPINSLILTKLDESPGLGQLLEVWPELTLPISYLTTGQDVPNDIEPAVSPRLARMILGIESPGTK
jgi:flagellar biosynthesis protein FlhF